MSSPLFSLDKYTIGYTQTILNFEYHDYKSINNYFFQRVYLFLFSCLCHKRNENVIVKIIEKDNIAIFLAFSFYGCHFFNLNAFDENNYESRQNNVGSFCLDI